MQISNNASGRAFYRSYICNTSYYILGKPYEGHYDVTTFKLLIWRKMIWNNAWGNFVEVVMNDCSAWGILEFG